MIAIQPSILDHLLTEAPFGLTSHMTIQGEEVVAIGLDNGNDAAKVSLLNREGRAIGVRIPTAYQPAVSFQSGLGEVTYQLGDGTSFWIGEVAMRNEGEALRVGPTAQRFADARQQPFVGAVLVEALLAAGYAPGAYALALGFAIPNTEIVKEAAGSEKLVVAEETRQTLKKHLHGQTWPITRTDARGRATHWTLTVQHLLPQAQSVGTFIAWSKAPNGAKVIDYDTLTILDIGGGDLHKTDIWLKPYRLSTERIGSGTIEIARGLIKRLPKARLNDVTAQHALVSRQALISGKLQPVSNDVDEVLQMYGHTLVGRMLPTFQETRRYVIITGGGAILLHQPIIEVLSAAGKAQGQDYLLVNHGLASGLNAMGALFAVLFMAARKA
jgi:hypothetical protein